MMMLIIHVSQTSVYILHTVLSACVLMWSCPSPGWEVSCCYHLQLTEIPTTISPQTQFLELNNPLSLLFNYVLLLEMHL